MLITFTIYIHLLKPITTIANAFSIINSSDFIDNIDFIRI